MFTLDPCVLNLLRCPHQQSELSHLTADQLQQLNQRIHDGAVKNSAGQSVTKELDAGLVNAEGSHAYRVRSGIMRLIADEAIVLDSPF